MRRANVSLRLAAALLDSLAGDKKGNNNSLGCGDRASGCSSQKKPDIREVGAKAASKALRAAEFI